MENNFDKMTYNSLQPIKKFGITIIINIQKFWRIG